MRIIPLVFSLFSFFVAAGATALPPKPRSLEETIKALESPVLKRLEPALIQAKVNIDDFRGVTLIYLKTEKILEIWANTKEGNVFIKSYPLTATSGEVGPKYKEGDRQIPEGLYSLTHFNPNSAYHLSLGVNYPNRQDKDWAIADGRDVNSLGGDIMVHGKNVTIGCIPIGDEAIEEIFYMVFRAGIYRSDIIMSPVDFRMSHYQSQDKRENQRYEEIKEYMKIFERQYDENPDSFHD